KTGIGLASMFNGRTAAGSADGIPLDTYGTAGRQTVLSLYGLLGLAQLVICLVCVVVLLRYRSLVPLMLALLLLYQAGRELVFYFMPIARVGAPPVSAINLALLALLIVGLGLALRRRDTPSPG
ncbi:MAG TPA: hypothetical protein VFU23_07385, partial [Gemmatimonadales bacterium]|nr:hypothetical protein [Gemmatimonadales bacterium]